ncbi:MAG: hypothetical protein IIA82_10220 [Thaumarchaeota archaeon]|nr:hypothetical protein [Nitrososphaerota archaeon]
MINSKAIGGIIAGIALIAIITVFASNSNQDTIPDTAEFAHQVSDVNISDSATVIKNPTNNTNYIIDENGNKKYFISVVDSPDLQD